MKQIWFVAAPPVRPNAGHLVDLSGLVNPLEWPSHVVIDLAGVYGDRADEWKKLFVEWLGGLNRRNASLEWWAHTTTAKNFLSSPLGNHLFQVLALCDLLGSLDYKTLFVVAATPAQVRFTRAWLAHRGFNQIRVRQSLRTRWTDAWLTLPRLVFQALRLCCALFVFAPRLPAPSKQFDLALFTYLDLKVNEDADAFFGRLPQILAEQSPGYRVMFTGFVHSPMRATLTRLQGFARVTYWPMFLALRPIDVLWALWNAVREMDSGRYDLSTPLHATVGFDVLLRAALRWDLGSGGYLHNVLLYRAARRFAEKFAPRMLAYPYENKALDKMLILGIREVEPSCHLTGYQHTSITPRHVTLMFAAGEAKVTPLPERIITVGEISRRYLEREGNYPKGIFATGCALRQTPQKPAIPETLPRMPERVLLALSSSRIELMRSVRFFRRVAELSPGLRIGIRAHPEFPLRCLSQELLEWVRGNCEDFSGTNLVDNLAWCNVTAYVSSTVALESLAAGKPIIHFAIGEFLDPDPILGNPALHWRISNHEEFSEVLASIHALTPEQYLQLEAEAAAYVRGYLRPVSSECAKLFLSPSSAACLPSGAENIPRTLDARSSQL